MSLVIDKWRWNRITAYTSDLGGMIDKIHGGISVVAKSYFLVHEYLVGEGVEDFGLLVLRRVGLGGVCGTAEGIVLLWTPAARLEGCGEGGDGEGEEGKEGCGIHLGWWVSG